MKLYEVTAEVTVFVVAEDEAEARDEGQRALEDSIRDNGCEPDTTCEVTHRSWPLPADWAKDHLVFGTDKDTTLGSLLDALPERSSGGR